MSSDREPRLIDVALPVPLYRAFTYALSREFANPIEPGSRVLVPFRNRSEIGIVVGVDVPRKAGVAYKEIAEVPDAAPALTPALLATCQWMADHYIAPIGIALRSALPARLTGASDPSPTAKSRRTLVLARQLESLLERDALFRRAPRQREVYELLEALGGRAPVDHLFERLQVSEGVIRALVARGVARFEREAVERDPFATRASQPPSHHQPTAAQETAIDAVGRGSPGEVFLLHGVTGSGKTLVYLEVLRRVVDVEGRTAIVLVPEIALTPQTVDRFRAVFGDRVAVLHSALSDGERLDAWRALRRGEKRIAVGARSAIFAPFERVGAIIVDEEHETSYKQNETPRYNARDVAIVRARHEGAVVVLGSATPSLESWVQAKAGRYHLLTLPDRVGGGSLPSIEIVHLGTGRTSASQRREERQGDAERVTAWEQDSARGGPPENQNASAHLDSRHHSIAAASIATPAYAAGALQPTTAGELQPMDGGGMQQTIAGATPPAPAGETPTALPTPPAPAGETPTAGPPDHPDLHDRVPSPPQRPSLGSDAFRRVVSEPLERALRDRIARREQTILLLNRRGYAAFIQCADCGDVAACPNCSISLTYHRTPERLVCHYCGHGEPMRTRCARCAAVTVRQRGLGTQQVERLLGERFPAARIARMDVDTTSGKWAHAEILDRVAAGEVDILLGTQMIAKGLDFPNVTLVGVIDADVGINLPDFRASERTYQLLAQVAGRAGRGVKGGHVVIQTRVADHHAVKCAVSHSYQAFVDEELPARSSPRYPPSVRLANIVFSAMTENGAERIAQEATAWLRKLLASRRELALTLIGPAPCPVERIKNRWRWHTLLKADGAPNLTRVLRYFAERYDVPNREGVRVVVDRDPVNLL